MGSYPETDVARASLFQMNEISRRAVGMSFNTNVSGAASASGPAQPPGTNGAPGASTSTATANASNLPRPRSAQQIFAAAAGLLVPQINPSEEDPPLSRQDALARMEELQRNRPQSVQGSASLNADGSNVPSGSDPFVMSADASAADGMMAQYPPQTISHEGLQVFTLGHLLPRSGEDDANGNWTFDANSLSGLLPLPLNNTDENDVVNPSPTTGNPSASFETRPPSVLRVRRSAYVPGWAVPPRVLLVEDDAVSRKLSSKFLQVFGCTIDVAVDGVGAVNKMNLEKYDLVLMVRFFLSSLPLSPSLLASPHLTCVTLRGTYSIVLTLFLLQDIVMPKLDGVSATNLIRQFDHMTPIISMTSNSKPNEIMTYYHSGMNDILPKPFTKEGLLGMLEVCAHFSTLFVPPGAYDGNARALETFDTPQGDPTDG
jgi:osomolarity two-component system response regulator SKN7